jgi:hypothetical protein
MTDLILSHSSFNHIVDVPIERIGGLVRSVESLPQRFKNFSRSLPDGPRPSSSLRPSGPRVNSPL